MKYTLNEQENIDHLERLVELTIVHWNRGNNIRAFDHVCRDILKESDLDRNDTIRRDHDGISHVDVLIEKMIAEIITEGEPNF